jgi:hypothetical protein
MEGEQGATGGKASPTSESPPSTPVNGVSDQDSPDAKVCRIVFLSTM